MKYKTLGKSGIKVSEIGFGAWTIALNWWGKQIEEDEEKFNDNCRDFCFFIF